MTIIWTCLNGSPQLVISESPWLVEEEGELRIYGVTEGGVQESGILTVKRTFSESIRIETDVKLKAGVLEESTGSLSLAICGEDGTWIAMTGSGGYTLLVGLDTGPGERFGFRQFFGNEDLEYHRWSLEYDKAEGHVSAYVDGHVLGDWHCGDLGDVTIAITHHDPRPGTDTDLRIDSFGVRDPQNIREYYAHDITDVNGLYELPRLKQGVYTIAATAISNEDLLGTSSVVEISAAESRTVDFTLGQGASVVGRVLDHQGNGVSSAAIELLETAGRTFHTGACDAGGSYTLRGVSAGDYVLTAIPSNPNLSPTSTAVRVADRVTEVADLKLAQTGSIAGRITDIDGAPATDVYVFLTGDERPRHPVDVNGLYMIPGLQPGIYEINTDTSETSFHADSRSATVSLGQTTTADFVLEGGRVFVRMSGQICDTTDAPLTNVSVWIKNLENDLGWTTTTDTDGRFEFARLPIGPYVIEINNDWPGLPEYTSLEIGGDNALDVTTDLEMSITLWRIALSMTADSQTSTDGTLVDVSIAVTNNDVHDLTDWRAFARLQYKNYVDVLIDYNDIPIELAAGERKSIAVRLTVPEGNPHPELELSGGIFNLDKSVGSNVGPVVALTQVAEERSLLMPGDVARDSEVWNINDPSNVITGSSKDSSRIRRDRWKWRAVDKPPVTPHGLAHLARMADEWLRGAGMEGL